jgi:GT2 family glycosyltransferase
MSRLRKISVVVLSWNGRQHLEACLPALRAQKVPGFEWEVLVLDNGSYDDTVEWVGRHHPEVRLIESKVNLGFCAGNNRLVQEADGEAVVFLNNDTRPRPGWLAALADTLASAPEDVAAVSGQIVDWEGERLDFARGALTFDGHAFQLDSGRLLAEVEVPVAGSELLFACGGNMIVRKASFLAAGGFDERYFAYLEDVDLGWRLWSGGERVLFCPEAVVHHRSMATSQHLGDFNRGFLFERNAFLTVCKNYEEGLWQEIMPAVLLTLSHRTQTLLVQNNPGGEQLTVDPFAGHIANTAYEAGDAGESSSVEEAQGIQAVQPQRLDLIRKFRGYGPREFLKRGLKKAAHRVLPDWIFDTDPDIPRLTDGRSVAQLRATTNILALLESSQENRAAIQARRKRGDREIFERFPLYLVPTYPGDEALFGRVGWNAWLPKDLPLRRRRLSEIMLIKP